MNPELVGLLGLNVLLIGLAIYALLNRKKPAKPSARRMLEAAIRIEAGRHFGEGKVMVWVDTKGDPVYRLLEANLVYQTRKGRRRSSCTTSEDSVSSYDARMAFARDLVAQAQLDVTIIEGADKA